MEEFDEKYEFAAPQFHDFSSAMECDDNADSWFDVARPSGEFFKKITAQSPKSTKKVGFAQSASKPPQMEQSKAAKAQTVAASHTRSRLGAFKNNSMNRRKSMSVKHKVSVVKVGGAPANRDAPATVVHETQSLSHTHSAGAEVEEQRTVAVAFTSPAKENHENLPATPVRAVKVEKKLILSKTPRSKKGPKTPKCATHQPKSKRPPTSEELEYMRMLEGQKQAAEVLKRNKLSYKKALMGDAGGKARVEKKPPTQPVEFHFHHTSKHTLVWEKTPTRERKRVAYTGQVTKPKPFNFHPTRKAAEPQQPVEPYVPLAAAVSTFQCKTPSRFHSSTKQLEPQPQVPQPPTLTQPHTPVFATSQRLRGPRELSQADREAQYMAAVPKFKASALDRRILESAGDYGVPKIPKRELTEPQEFHFHSKPHQPQSEPLTPAEQSPPHLFKATKLNRGIFTHPPHLPAVPEKELTVPCSPAFASKLLPKRTTPQQPGAQPPSIFKANPMPVVEKPFRPKHNTAPLTLPASPPLATEERGQEYQQRWQEQLQQAAAEMEQQRLFRAQPLPDLDDPHLPVPSEIRPLTCPEPFHLSGEGKKEKLAEKIRQELEEEKKQFSSFRAKNVPRNEPFKPKVAARQVLPQTPLLHSQRRAQERQQYEEKRAQEYELAQEAHRRQEEQRKMEEESALRAARQQMVHKAQPIRKFKPLPERRAKMPLTAPKTPSWGKKKRPGSAAKP